MADRKEGSGLRSTRVPNRASLRDGILAFFAENPGSMLTRREIMNRFGVSGGTVDSVAHLLKRGGHITRLMGPGGIVGYKAASLPDPKPAKPRKVAKPIRAWPSEVHYVATKPIAISIFHLADAL